MNGGWRWTMFSIGFLALILQAIQTFPSLKNGSYFSLGAIVFYLLIGLVVVSVVFLISTMIRNRHHEPAQPTAELPYPDLRSELHDRKEEVYRLRSELSAAQNKIAEVSIEREQLHAQLELARKELQPFKERQAEEESKRAKLLETLRSAPKLWVDYKPKDPAHGTESFVFSKDGDQTIVNIEPGPLIWNLSVKREITFLNNVSPVRTQPVECRIAVSGGSTSLGGIPDYLRDIIRRYETTVSPLMTLAYETSDGAWFQQAYSLSIDPYSKLVIKPEGQARLHTAPADPSIL